MRGTRTNGAQGIHGDGRVEAFNKLNPHIASLREIVRKLSDCEDEIAAVVRRAKLNFWLGATAKFCGIVLGAVALGKIVWSAISRFL